MLHEFVTWNGPMPTTAAQAVVVSETAIETLLQLASPASRKLAILAWGYTLDDPPGADSIIELVQTDVAATGLTAHVAAGVQPMDPSSQTTLLTLGTAATGYATTSSPPTEGAITATRVFDAVALSSVSAEAAPALTRMRVFDVPRIVAASSFLRVRITTPTTGVGIRCWIHHGE